MRRLACAVFLIVSGLLFGMTRARADSYQKIATIPLTPKVSADMDIGWVDPGTQRYYVADRTNQSIDIIDTTTNKMLGQIPGFVGVDVKAPGPNGVMVIPDTQELWAGDGDSTVKVIDLATQKIVATIPTGGTARANELAYDPKDHIFIIGNDRDDIPFLSFIATDTRKILGKIDFPDAAKQDGIHQPVWNPADGLFYMSTPATKTNPGGEVDVIDPLARSVKAVYPLPDCGGHGIALGPNQDLLIGCGKNFLTEGTKAQTHIVDARTGEIVATFPQVGGSDEVWYNPGDDRYYLAAYSMTDDGTATGKNTPVLGVIQASTREWLMNVPTSPLAKAVAVDPKNNRIYLPMTNEGIGVFAISADGR